ncbi:hypothetical protein ACFLWU_07045 [Chloroflexota bacterium]
MRPGLGEIILIVVIIIAAAVIARIIRTGRSTSRQSEASPAVTSRKSSKSKTRARTFFTKGGIALVLSGIVVLLAGMSMFRWAIQSYLWAFIIVVVGFALLILSRKI